MRGPEATAAGERRWVGRAELVLARADHMPLRILPLDPDPLTHIASAMAGAADDEQVAVAIDLLALSAGDRRRRRRAVVAAAGPGGRRHQTAAALWGPGGLAGLAASIWGGGQATPWGPASPRGRGRGPASPAPQAWLARQEQRGEDRAVADKVFGHEPAFWLQLLIRTESGVPGRHVALLQAVVGAFEVYAGENYLSLAGTRLGPFFVGADSLWGRRRFDRRWATGLHRPARRQMVTTAEVAPLLKPPTRHCHAHNVARSGGVVCPPPRGLPTWVEGRDDLMPLGHVRERDGDRPTGIPLAETLFGYTAGRTGEGKTYSALARAAAVFRSGAGGFYLDPHGDGVATLKEYLTPLRNVVEIDLTNTSTDRQAGWNLFSMQGATVQDIEAKVSAVVLSFAAALGWGESSTPRALTLTTMAAQALCELALRLPAGLAPTIFQMPTLLGDDDWRAAVMPHLSAHSREFFLTRFPRMDPSATTPVTNLIDRMRSSPSLAALLGSSRSTYDVRRAMDSGQVVLWSTPSATAWTELLTGFVTYDLFRAAMSRRNLAPAKRRVFWAWIDELQRVSGTGSGKAGEAVARALEEARKMGLRLQLMSQQPSRLAAPTLEAIMTNRSMLASHKVGADSAKRLAGEWGGAIAGPTITRLPAHHFVVQVTLNGQVSEPFRVRGFDLANDHPWVDWHDPAGVARLDARIDRNLRRRPVETILAELDTLPERIADHLQHATGRRRRGAEQGEAPGEGTGDPFDPAPGHGRRRASGQLIVLAGGTDEDQQP